MSDPTENDDATPVLVKATLTDDEVAMIRYKISRAFYDAEDFSALLGSHDALTRRLVELERTPLGLGVTLGDYGKACTEILVLRARLVELERAHDALRQDAERLNWLDDHGELAVYFVKAERQFNTGMQSLRSAIDAARLSDTPHDAPSPTEASTNG